MAEGAALEMLCAVYRTGGSNPPLSAPNDSGRDTSCRGRFVCFDAFLNRRSSPPADHVRVEPFDSPTPRLFLADAFEAGLVGLEFRIA